MITITDKFQCCGCHACAAICPQNCISMQPDDEGFYYPKINVDLCIQCNRCEEVCPVMEGSTLDHTPIAYAAFNKNEAIRMASSSGGIFTLIAEEIINQGGVVFGACFDTDFNVVHDFTEQIVELAKFRGSKYVQSKIGSTYRLAKSFLDEGRMVLFTGTPCQISGLKAYLQKDYDCLICQDIICHGVPSPKVWRKYIEHRESCAAAAAQRIAFREKNEGWKRYSVSFLFKNNTEYRQTADKDLMMQAFLQNVCLRHSCYSCSFKTLSRQSDITLADFWGVENILPEMDDDKGTSLVLLHSEKGKKLFDVIRNQLRYQRVNLTEAIKYNTAAIKSADLNPKRSEFMRNIDAMDLNKAVKKYCGDSFWLKCKRIVYRVLSKIKRTIFVGSCNDVQK
ncbi:MAG: Coenzyme F420 hydrogenase/dehydrogenase, beta subunit C-terminal domain [Oscillospiraceae bacterium]